jgi:hypothetical protein
MKHKLVLRRLPGIRCWVLTAAYALMVLLNIEARCDVNPTDTQIQYLSGTDKDHTLPWQFYMTGGGRSNNVLTTIPVPSCWQTKGFGNYSYGGDSPASASVGQYSTVFSVPTNWAGKKIYLVYEGVLTDTATLINGQLIAGPTTNSTISAATSSLLDDRAFDNTASTGQGETGGIALSKTENVNLGTLNQFTLTAWIKPEADFSTMSYTRYPRIMMVGATTGYDTSVANGVALLGYNAGGITRGLQLTVNTGSVLTPNDALTGSDWIFVAVTYDSTLANNNVKFYLGSRISVPALFSTQTLLQGPVAFGANAYAYLLNRATLDRAFDGWGDDFRMFNGALDQTALDGVRASAISTSAPPATTALYQWNFNTPTTGTNVLPNLGSGGVLTLEDSNGYPTNLYGPIGLSVSGSPVINTIVTTSPHQSAHQGGFYEFSYDVTTNVIIGASTNVLSVTVKELSDNDSVNNAEREGDYWNFSGIFRPVYLMAKPQSNIERLAVDAKASGQINVSVFLSGITNNCLVVASVADTNNTQLGSSFTNTATAGMTNVLLSATLPSPQMWSAEFPNLYTLTVQLQDTNSVTIHTVTNLIGFRTITFSNGVGYLVNGKKVLLRGICRHEFWPTDGRTSSREEGLQDIGLIKDMNFNAVRMTHYPPAQHFLEECDRLGLYVFDELAGWNQAYDNTIAPKVVKELVIRDVNHPCIIAWDNGNEDGWNTSVDNQYALWDPQNRHVNHPWATFNNVVDDHYPTWSTFSGRFAPGATAYLPTEILHGLYDGGAGASLSDYWDMMRTSANGAGMFLWVFHDEGVVRDDLGGGIDVHGQSAPDGIVGPFRQPEASYYTYKAVYNPVQVTGPAPGAAFNGTFPVENRFSFTSLNQCAFHWQLGWYPDANDPANTFNTSTNALTGGLIVAIESGNFSGPSVAPGTTGLLVLPDFPANGTNYDALRVIATDPHGDNLYTWTWPLHTPAQIRARIVGVASATAPVITAGVSASEIIVTNGPRIFHFSKTTGVINGLTISNQTVSLSNGPRPAVGSAWTVSSITNYYDGTNYIVRMNNITNAGNGFQWTLRPDGWLNLTFRYTQTGAQDYMGITFDYPGANITAMSWLGQGPYRIYKNRTAGQEVFVHTKTANNTWTGQGPLVFPGTIAWVYPEFAGYHGQLNWATVQTTERPITIATPTTNLFFRVITPPTTDKSAVNPAYPPGAISLLHGIAPQGDKFHAAGLSSYGPSSAQNSATGLYTGEVSFIFGALPPSGADRDSNSLVDAWELQYFGALGQNPATLDANGVSLALANAFDLSPTNADPNVSRLPQAAPGTVTPIALAYRVPVSQLDYFSFIPQITDNLISNWFRADAYPQYFLINSALTNGSEIAYTVEPNLTNWSGNPDNIFLRLEINKR